MKTRPFSRIAAAHVVAVLVAVFGVAASALPTGSPVDAAAPSPAAPTPSGLVPLGRANPGDGSAVVYIANTGFPGLTNGMKYNSSGGNIDTGRIDDSHYWISFANLGGGTYVNAQITNWDSENSPAIAPVCTIDKAKDNGTDVTLWFQCTPFPGHSLIGTSLFISVTNAPHPDRAGATGPGFVALTSTDPGAAVHTPLNQYRSSGAGQASVTRTGVGQYTVTVPNATYPKGGGAAVATALTVSPAVDPAYTRYCNVQSWAPSAGSMVVRVQCYHGGGVLSDGRFSLRLSLRSHTGGAQPGGAQWVGTPASAGYDTSAYGWNSSGAANHVAGLAPGSSRVDFPGAIHDPARVWTLAMTPYGGNHRCSVEGVGAQPGTGALFTMARCYTPLGGAPVANGRYTISVAEY